MPESTSKRSKGGRRRHQGASGGGVAGAAPDVDADVFVSDALQRACERGTPRRRNSLGSSATSDSAGGIAPRPDLEDKWADMEADLSALIEEEFVSRGLPVTPSQSAVGAGQPAPIPEPFMPEQAQAPREETFRALRVAAAPKQDVSKLAKPVPRNLRKTPAAASEMDASKTSSAAARSYSSSSSSSSSSCTSKSSRASSVALRRKRNAEKASKPQPADTGRDASDPSPPSAQSHCGRAPTDTTLAATGELPDSESTVASATQVVATVIGAGEKPETLGATSEQDLEQLAKHETREDVRPLESSRSTVVGASNKLPPMDLQLDVSPGWQKEATCTSNVPPGLAGEATDGYAPLARQEPRSEPSDDVCNPDRDALGNAVLPPLKGVRCIHRLWFALVILSVLQAGLICAGTLLDKVWSPCRVPLEVCSSLHIDDCLGLSCREAAPDWAAGWPMAGLLFLALPMRSTALSSSSSGSARKPVQPGRCRQRLFAAALVASIAVMGAGAVALLELWAAGTHYASRCPMQRATAHCSAALCPTPPCRRENSFSPCLCGRLEEGEMARALFLKGSPACQPYEWYPAQMASLEQLVLEYETFACMVGPIVCSATGVGLLLLLVQLVCCPMLLVGRWGGQEVLFFLLATDEELDRALIGGAAAAGAAQKRSSDDRAKEHPRAVAGTLGWSSSHHSMGTSPECSEDGNSGNGSAGSAQCLLQEASPAKSGRSKGQQLAAKPHSGFDGNGAMAVFATAASRDAFTPPTSRQRRSWDSDVTPTTVGRC